MSWEESPKDVEVYQQALNELHRYLGADRRARRAEATTR